MLFAQHVRTGRHFSRINIQSVLPFFRETYIKGYYVLRNAVRNEFGQTFLFNGVLVQRCHEIGKLS